MKITNEGFAVLEQDTHLSRWIEEQGKLCHDEAVPKFILPHINKGDTVIDAGAALGDHTSAYLNAVTSDGMVVAFEPNRKLYDCLVWNCPRAVCVRMALWDSWTLMDMVEDPNAGAGYVMPGGEGELCGVPLDMFHFNRVDFIKMDIEGAEPRALQGAATTIAKHRPKIVVEVNRIALRRHRFVPEDIFRFFEQNRYSVGMLQPDAPNVSPDQYDILAIPK
jgi:FkbM family methyltransferase